MGKIVARGVRSAIAVVMLASSVLHCRSSWQDWKRTMSPLLHEVIDSSKQYTIDYDSRCVINSARERVNRGLAGTYLANLPCLCAFRNGNIVDIATEAYKYLWWIAWPTQDEIYTQLSSHDVPQLAAHRRALLARAGRLDFDAHAASVVAAIKLQLAKAEIICRVFGKPGDPVFKWHEQEQRLVRLAIEQKFAQCRDILCKARKLIKRWNVNTNLMSAHSLLNSFSIMLDDLKELCALELWCRSAHAERRNERWNPIHECDQADSRFVREVNYLEQGKNILDRKYNKAHAQWVKLERERQEQLYERQRKEREMRERERAVQQQQREAERKRRQAEEALQAARRERQSAASSHQQFSMPAQPSVKPAFDPEVLVAEQMAIEKEIQNTNAKQTLRTHCANIISRAQQGTEPDLNAMGTLISSARQHGIAHEQYFQQLMQLQGLVSTLKREIGKHGRVPYDYDALQAALLAADENGFASLCLVRDARRILEDKALHDSCETAAREERARQDAAVQQSGFLQQDNQCVICFDDIEADMYITKCGHKFHRGCINDWFKKSRTCPTCRAAQ